MFEWYKIKNDDITFDYFKHYNNCHDIKYSKTINYQEFYQFKDYRQIDSGIYPFIEKYFTPSVQVKSIIQCIEEKYNIDYENICVLFYRGNDKITETRLCGYEEYKIYADNVIQKHPNVRFLIQSDETEFIEQFTSEYANTFCFKDEIRHIPKCMSTVDKCLRENIDVFSKNYLAITCIMAKCKYIICGSGNCSIWIMLYRGNSNNIYQNLNGEWIIT
jgi:hypothetical protein